MFKYVVLITFYLFFGQISEGQNLSQIKPINDYSKSVCNNSFCQWSSASGLDNIVIQVQEVGNSFKLESFLQEYYSINSQRYKKLKVRSSKVREMASVVKSQRYFHYNLKGQGTTGTKIFEKFELKRNQLCVIRLISKDLNQSPKDAKQLLDRVSF